MPFFFQKEKKCFYVSVREIYQAILVLVASPLTPHSSSLIPQHPPARGIICLVMNTNLRKWCITTLLAATWLLLTAMFCLSLTLPAQAHSRQAQIGTGPLLSISIDSTMTTNMVAYMRRALRTAEASNANALIIKLHTGGAVLRDIRPLANDIAQAKVAVVVFVTPGTNAGAAGAFLLSAAHVSVLAPNTSFGSPYPLTQVDSTLSQQTRSLLLDTVSDQLRSWNQQRGRSVGWIDQALRSGLILTNEQALATQPAAIDAVAADENQLMSILDGRIIIVEGGQQVQLKTLGQIATPVQASLSDKIWIALADPTLAFALLVMGAMVIGLEFAAPGTTIFLGAGIILIIAAIIGLVALPIQAWAIGLILLGLVLIGCEFFVSTHGALALTGLAILSIGGLNMIDPLQAPGVGVALWAIILIGLGVAGLAAGMLVLALRNRQRPVSTGQDALIGRTAEVRKRLDPQGMIFVEGALWQAVSEEGNIETGEWVRIVAMHRLQLIVKRLDSSVTIAE